MFKVLFTALWVLLVALLTALLALVPLHQGVADMVVNTVDLLQQYWQVSLFFALLTGLSLWLFFSQFRVGPSTPSSVVIQAEEGEVRIALAAVETLIQQAAAQLKGVREIRTSFFSKAEELGVYIKAVVTSDGSIPELSSQLQKAVKDHVLRIAGIHIAEVRVLVENVTAGVRNRVELR